MTCDEADCAPGVGSEKDADWQDHPEDGGGGSHGHEHGRADGEADEGARYGLHGGLARRQRVGAQGRQRAQYDPERVLQLEESGDEHGQREADRDAEAIVQHAGGRCQLGAECLAEANRDPRDARAHGDPGRHADCGIHARPGGDSRVAAERKGEIGHHLQRAVGLQAVEDILRRASRS